ncbi:RNase H domain-containing protein [Trichonephila clavipes]|nr:RNase H domain-containing protein [Trichonephila clavipes]
MVTRFTVVPPNLQKLERVQLSAARILTGLCNSCPCDIVLFEADLQPLSVRRNSQFFHIKLRNSDSCSVFRSELIAIDTCLKDALSIPGSNSIWILSDSRSAIQHLSNWHKEGDNTGVAILEKLKHLSSSREIHLIQWVSSHVNIVGNGIADSLAKDGAVQHTMNSSALIYLELHSTNVNSRQTTVPPAHHWYEAKRPGGSLFLQCSREEQTILTRFRSDHLQILTFRDGTKVFPTFVRCSACQASPEHILDCLVLSKQDLYENPLIVLDF